jgi:cyanophycinase-like exopeptidase
MLNHSFPVLHPGPIVLFGSGETTASGRKAFDYVLRRLPAMPKIALLETPAGFELNSPMVIGRVADLINHSLKNYQPQVTVVPARRRGTPYSPDEPEIVAPLLEAQVIFMGPGSPTYAVRQLHDSLAWNILWARHRLGATIALASAAAIAISAYALPVYEIYKVGEDLHWKPGLDFFSPYGLPLVFVPHWNNNDGGEELDTSRCFMGQDRFARLMALLPPGLTVVGLDEKTALVMEPEAGTCRVIGVGSVTLLHTGHEHSGWEGGLELEASGLGAVARQRDSHVHQYKNGETFPLGEIGDFCMPDPGYGLPPEVWQQAVEVQQQTDLPSVAEPAGPPPEALALLAQREAARLRKDWPAADALRKELADLGWQVMDTPEGSKLVSSE